jgi:hypothetical protein
MAIYNALFRDGGSYIFTDYTAYEAHFVPEVMRSCQFKLYKHMTRHLSCYDDVMRFCFSTLAGRNKCIFKNVTVGINGVRMSGEMDTSLANGFHNLMAFLYLCWKNGAKDVVGFVEGDDGLFRVEPPSAAPSADQFSLLGFTIKIGVTDRLSEASFCGQVYDIDEGIVVTDVLDALSRFGWTNKKYVRASFPTRLELLRARGYSMVYQYNGCPVLSTLGRKILELTEGVQIRQTIIDSLDLWERAKLNSAISNLPVEKIPGPATRFLVEKLFGLPVEVQIDWERRISQQTEFGPLPINLDDYCPKEWIDYYDRYSHPIFDTNPLWLVKDEAVFCSYLKEMAPQTEKFLNSL